MAFALGASAVVLYAFPAVQLARGLTVVASGLVPYGILAWLVAAILLFSAGRGWTGAAALAALAGLVLQLSWAQPYWPRSRSVPSGSEEFTVLTMNFRCDALGMDGLLDAARNSDADVVVLQGVGAAELRELGEGAWPERYPHRTFHPLPSRGTCGSVVYSRLPLREAQGTTYRQPVIEVDSSIGPVVVVPVDIPTPTADMTRWLDAFDQLASAVEAHDGALLVMAGDFNAVLEHHPMRHLLAVTALRDAAELSGAGWQPTFPADRWHPPVVALDHVLVSSALGATAVETARIGDNSHLAVVTHLVPADG